MTTPIYGFPSPVLTGIADGPDALSLLAARVEREMSVFRSSAYYARETTLNIPSGGGVAVHSVTHPLAVIGWMAIELTVGIGPSTGGVIAGTIQIAVDAVSLRNVRYHSQIAGNAVYTKTITAYRAVTAAQTTSSIVANVYNDAAANPCNFYHSEIYVASFGAPNP